MNGYLDTGLWNPPGNYVYDIVPVEEESPMPAPSRGPSQAPSYETPYWWDTINRAIERAAQVATIEVGGYPPYPSYPTPSPAPYPTPPPGDLRPRQPGEGIHLSQTTLMLLVGGVLLFMLGGKRGR